MKKGSVILSMALVLGMAAACAKQALQTTYDKQATYIESFVSSQMKADTNATLIRNGGSYRLTLHDTLDRVLGKRDSLQDGGKVALWYVCYTLTGNSLTTANVVATNAKEIDEQLRWNLSDSTRFKLDTLTLDKSLVEGLRLGLQGVQQYDEGYVLFTGQYGFGNIARGTIPARSALVYQYWIEKIYNE